MDFQRRTTVVLQIQKGCVDANLVAEPGVLAPHDSISTAELRDATNHRGINGSPGSDPQIGEHLVQAVGRNGAETRRLAYVGAEHVREARAKPIERRIAGRIAEGKNGEGGLFHGRSTLSRKNLAAKSNPQRREQGDRGGTGDPGAITHERGNFFGLGDHRRKRWRDSPHTGGHFLTQVLQNFSGTRETLVAVNFQALHHYVADRLWNRRIHFRGRRRPLLGAFQEGS